MPSHAKNGWRAQVPRPCAKHPEDKAPSTWGFIRFSGRNFAYDMPPGYMVSKNLYEISVDAKAMDEMLTRDDTLPGWAEHDISVARAKLHDIRAYLEHEMMRGPSKVSLQKRDEDPKLRFSGG